MSLSLVQYPSSYVFIAAPIVQLFIVIFLAKRSYRSATIFWFLLTAMLATASGIAQLIASFSQNINAYEAWYQLYVGFAIFTTPCWVVFALHFVRKDAVLKHIHVCALLFAPAFVVAYILWASPIPALNAFATVAVTPWGYAVYPSLIAKIIGMYFGLYSLAVVFLFLGYYRRVQQPLKRREIRIIVVALVAFVLSTSIAEGLMPNITHQPVFPSSVVTTTLMLALVAYALIKYGVGAFNPEGLVGNVGSALPGALFVLDHTNTIQYANDGSVKLLRYPAAGLIGAGLGVLFPRSVIPASFRTKVLESHEINMVVELEDITLQAREGVAVPTNVNATRVVGEDGEQNTIVIFTSIARLKETQTQLAAEKAGVEDKVVERTRELTEARAQLEASIRSLPFGFAIIDPQDQIVFHNQLLARFFHQAIPDDLAASRTLLRSVGRSMGSAFDLLADIHDVRAKAAPVERSVEIGPLFYRILITPVQNSEKDKAVLGVVLVMEDITDAKAMERSREEFFSIASHELRTPLTAIRGNADMVLKYFGDRLNDPSASEMVTDIHDASTRLIAIVNDFLDVSRLEQKRLEFKNVDFDIASLVQQTLKEYQVTGSRRKLYLELEPPASPLPAVNADPDRVRQILINLVGNALKFTAEGGIKIRLELQGSAVHVSVADTGKGIPIESQHLLFRKFQQATNNILTRDNSSGTGLGLYISALLAKGVHGKLYLAHSEVGKGSTFVLELPVAGLKRQEEKTTPL